MPGRQRIDALGRGRGSGRGRVTRLAEQLGKGHRSQADAALLQEPAARDESAIGLTIQVVLAVHEMQLLFLGDRLIEVQQDAGDDGPAGKLGGGRVGG